MSKRHDELYKKYMAFHGIMLEEYKSLEIAAVIVTQALSIYRTVLTEDEYQKMVDSIYNSKDQIKTFEQGF